jgi:hypothetical protein
MVRDTRGSPFYGKRAEAVLQIKKTFFALNYAATGTPEGLTGSDDEVYDALVARLEEIAEQGFEEHYRLVYGGREEGM